MAIETVTPVIDMGTGVRRHDPELRSFASDNCSGIHPEILAAIAAANGGHQDSYGEDNYSRHLQHIFKQHFGEHAVAFPILNGTGANVVALQAMTTRSASVICTTSAHIHLDECGAPERIGGLKLCPVPAHDGKLTPELMDTEAWGFHDVHRARPQVLSLTQATELGTVYSVSELAALCRHAHDLAMTVHMDGARIANAASSLSLPLRALTTDVGVDVLSFGGTKNGLMLGEAVVVLNPAAAANLEYIRKSSMQLASKMRFISAQFNALLGTDLWVRNAARANAMARRLAAAVESMPGIRILHPVESNAVFAILPPSAVEHLRERFRFLTWNAATGEVRWMTSFDTTEQDVDEFAAAICAELDRGGPPSTRE